MVLYEFEGKELFKKYGISIPNSQVVDSPSEKVKVKAPFFIKAQVLSGKRKDAGGIVEINKVDDYKKNLEQVLGKTINKEKVEKVLLEEKTEFRGEYYVSISYDTETRGAVVTYSEAGGTGIEERESHFFPIDILTSTVDYGNAKVDSQIKEFIEKILDLFLAEDATLVEINPAVITKNGEVTALDSKVKLDDEAQGRHAERNYPIRAIPGHKATKNEIAAKKIDEGDYRGTAGSAYFDLPGDIAILASGGGASLTAMDALLAAGGKPANYTEYSGNPPKEKVEKLTKIVLSKKGLNGLWIVGAIANFTDIYQTLSGFLEALRKIKPKPQYPIVIRRGGPHDKEAFEMLKKVKDFKMELYGQEISMTETAKIIAKEAKEYAATKK